MHNPTQPREIHSRTLWSPADYWALFVETPTARLLNRAECRVRPAVLLGCTRNPPNALDLSIACHIRVLLTPSGIGTLVA
jgi:hypothetical protein